MSFRENESHDDVFRVEDGNVLKARGGVVALDARGARVGSAA